MVEKIINFIKSNHPDYDEIVSFFGIEKEEIVAFGDNLNDIEMLSSVGYPFAMVTGKEAILEMCPYRTDKVEKTVRQILDGKFPE